MKTNLLLLLVLGFTFLAGGCLVVAAGAVGAGIVYTTGDDSSSVYFDCSRDEVFDASVAELDAQGSVDVRNRQESLIEGTVDDASVTIRLERPSSAMVRVTVSARKHLVGITPAPKIAERVANGIVERLRVAGP